MSTRKVDDQVQTLGLNGIDKNAVSRTCKDLDEHGRGSCPFHPPDRHPSFTVNRDMGYWVCFHEVNPETGRYLGGDAIEFYQRLNGLGFREAVLDLAGQCGLNNGLF